MDVIVHCTSSSDAALVCLWKSNGAPNKGIPAPVHKEMSVEQQNVFIFQEDAYVRR